MTKVGELLPKQNAANLALRVGLGQMKLPPPRELADLDVRRTREQNRHERAQPDREPLDCRHIFTSFCLKSCALTGGFWPSPRWGDKSPAGVQHMP